MRPTTVIQQEAPATDTTGAPANLRLETPQSAWARSGVGRSTAYELLARGDYPQPLKLGRANRYVSTEIDRWIAERIAERDAGLQAKGTA